MDYGTVRIGVAISDPGPADRQSAGELHPPHRRRSTPSTSRELAADEEIALWVVGLPVHLDGRESEKSREARRFGQWLGEATGVPVEFFDERFTTSEAEQLLSAAGLTSKRRKKRLDMLAAQIMLSAYLQSQTKGQEPPGPLDG